MALKSETAPDQEALFGEPDGNPFPDDTDAGAEPGAKAKPAAEPAADEDEWEAPTREEHEAMQRQIDEAQTAERTRNEALNHNQSRLIDLLARRQDAGPAPEPIGAMPDPTVEPEEFNTWLKKRDAERDAATAAEIRAVETRVSENQTVDQLFEEFGKLYPGVAEKRALVEAASLDAGLGRGDSKQKIFAETLRVLKEWGVPLTATPADPNRTGGLGGGGTGKRRRAAAKKEEDEEPQDLVDQIAQEQTRLGLH